VITEKKSSKKVQKLKKQVDVVLLLKTRRHAVLCNAYWEISLRSLRDKHPTNRPVSAKAVLPCDVPSVDSSIIFEEIDTSLIRKMALKCTGAHGPSGLTASEWKQLRTSFGTVSNDLCSAIAAATRHLCVCYIDPSCLSAFVACRLIALDKCPGVRPIGIGETVQRIMSKAILSVLRFDILQAARSSQLCAEQDSGCETVIHAVRELFTLRLFS